MVQRHSSGSVCAMWHWHAWKGDLSLTKESLCQHDKMLSQLTFRQLRNKLKLSKRKKETWGLSENSTGNECGRPGWCWELNKSSSAYFCLNKYQMATLKTYQSELLVLLTSISNRYSQTGNEQLSVPAPLKQRLRQKCAYQSHVGCWSNILRLWINKIMVSSWATSTQCRKY